MGLLTSLGLLFGGIDNKLIMHVLLVYLVNE